MYTEESHKKTIVNKTSAEPNENSTVYEKCQPGRRNSKLKKKKINKIYCSLYPGLSHRLFDVDILNNLDVTVSKNKHYTMFFAIYFLLIRGAAALFDRDARVLVG
jgi:hypothetical protein